MRLLSINAAMLVAVAARRLRRCKNTVVFAMSLTFAPLRSLLVVFAARRSDLMRTFYQVGVSPTCFHSSDRSFSTRWERFRRAKPEDIVFFRVSLCADAQNSTTLHRLLPSDIALPVSPATSHCLSLRAPRTRPEATTTGSEVRHVPSFEGFDNAPLSAPDQNRP